MRRLCAWLLAGLTFVLLLCTGPAAQAIDVNPFNNGCTPRLIVGTPTAGPANMIDGGPAVTRKGDPFAKDPKVSIYETYGYGGLSWPSFACNVVEDASGVSTDPGGSALGAIANIMLGVLALAIGVCAAIVRFAFAPGTLAVFDPIIRLGTQALGDNVFKALFWITLLVSGIGLVWFSRRQQIRDTAAGAAWVLFAGLLGFVAMAYPLVVAPTFDKVLTTTISAVNTELAGASGNTALSASDGMAANLHGSLLYETWCSGMVGRSAGDTADEYCPRLWESSTLSREEYAKTQKAEDPAQAMSDLVQKKGEAFKKASEDLEKDDPVAYSFLTGNHNAERVGYAALAWVGFWCAAPFMVVAALLLMFALIVVRMAIVIIPAVVVIGGFPSMRRYVTQVFDYTAGALITALVFGSLSAVFVAMVGAFMSPTTGVPTLLSMVLLLLATIVAWKFSKPFRRVQAFTSLRGRIPRSKGEPGDPELNPENYEDRRRGPRAPSAPVGGGMFTPAAYPAAYAGTPAEARQSMWRAATVGAVQGAGTSALLGIMSGGTVTVAGAAAGAARGAAGAAVASKIAGSEPGRHRAQVAAQAAESVARTPREVRALPAGATRAPEGGARARTQAPAEAKPRVYRPGDRSPADGMRVTEPTTTSAGERVYSIYTPEPKGAAR